MSLTQAVSFFANGNNKGENFRHFSKKETPPSLLNLISIKIEGICTNGLNQKLKWFYGSSFF